MLIFEAFLITMWSLACFVGLNSILPSGIGICYLEFLRNHYTFIFSLWHSVGQSQNKTMGI